MARVKNHLALKAMDDSLRDQNEFLELEVAKRMREVMVTQNVTIRSLAHRTPPRKSAIFKTSFLFVLEKS